MRARHWIARGRSVEWLQGGRLRDTQWITPPQPYEHHDRRIEREASHNTTLHAHTHTHTGVESERASEQARARRRPQPHDTMRGRRGQGRERRRKRRSPTAEPRELVRLKGLPLYVWCVPRFSGADGTQREPLLDGVLTDVLDGSGVPGEFGLLRSSGVGGRAECVMWLVASAADAECGAPRPASDEPTHSSGR